MSQKANPISLRLKKRLNWNIWLSLQNFKNYSPFLIGGSNINELTTFILLKFNFFTNNTIITKNSKNYQFFSKIIHENNAYTNLLIESQLLVRSHFLKNQKKYLSNLFLKETVILPDITDLLFNKNKVAFFNFIKKKFLLFSPRIITYFTIKQLKKTNKFKSKNFSKSLQLGLLKLTRRFLVLFKNNLIGIKIICSGKWKKTRSGRKQKLCLRFGKIRRTSTVNTLFYNFLDQRTKFGCCSVKVWISHKIL